MEEVAATAAEAVPRGQSEHALAPCWSLKVPAPQSTQAAAALAPMAALALPTGQSWQAVAPEVVE